jgi:hypothetical protein
MRVRFQLGFAPRQRGVASTTTERVGVILLINDPHVKIVRVLPFTVSIEDSFVSSSEIISFVLVDIVSSCRSIVSPASFFTGKRRWLTKQSTPEQPGDAAYSENS